MSAPVFRNLVPVRRAVPLRLVRLDDVYRAPYPENWMGGLNR